MKVLSGSDLAGYIKERQAHEVRALRQAFNVQPKLSIIVTVDNPVIDVYIRLKEKYGSDILIDVDIHRVKQSEVPGLLEKLNEDDSVHGIIIQLPLEEPEQTDTLVNKVAPNKDVDALGSSAEFDPATPTAILWLLAGYNVELRGRQILLIGRGKLVGAPLERMLLSSSLDVRVADSKTLDLKAEALEADIIVTATGTPAILSADMIKQGAVIVDAGVASEDGKTVGDVAEDVMKRDDLTITPSRGGVGPLTVTALFENVIIAARRTTVEQEHS
jgi:methylenetetrahydrofolate dehydrogenase (NADP+)/methenyltetrahydrofolate cyclohydrolase